MRGNISEVVYKNKLGFKTFYPCATEQGRETASTLLSQNEIVGLPLSLHSDNHKNFSEDLFKRLLSKFRIFFTYTELHYLFIVIAIYKPMSL